MGAAGFAQFIHGKTLSEAFAKAAEQDTYMNGHDPYTGTIGQKGSVCEFTLKRMPRSKKITPKPISYLDPESPSQPQPFIRSGPSVLVDLIEQAAFEYEGTKHKKKLIEFVGNEREAERLIELYSDKWSQTVPAIPLTGGHLAHQKERLGIKGTHQKVWLVVGSAAC